MNRFAAELLMPEALFRKSFFEYLKEKGFNAKRIRLDEIIRVMVMLMSDYMVPYEAVRRRLIESNIITEEVGKVLDPDKKGIKEIVEAFSKELNATFSNPTNKKAIPGLRDAIIEVEKKGTVSEYVISKIKSDFSVGEVTATDEILTISGEDD